MSTQARTRHIVNRGVRTHPERKTKDNTRKNNFTKARFELTRMGGLGSVAYCPCGEWFKTTEARNIHKKNGHKTPDLKVVFGNAI